MFCFGSIHRKNERCTDMAWTNGLNSRSGSHTLGFRKVLGVWAEHGALQLSSRRRELGIKQDYNLPFDSRASSAATTISTALFDEICTNVFARPASVALGVGFGPHCHCFQCAATCDKVVLHDLVRHQIYEPGEDQDGLLDQNRETNYLRDQHAQRHHDAASIHRDFDCRYDDHDHYHSFSNYGSLSPSNCTCGWSA
jgi:hypothetical protein